jgi:hypothetical protein
MSMPITSNVSAPPVFPNALESTDHLSETVTLKYGMTRNSICHTDDRLSQLTKSVASLGRVLIEVQSELEGLKQNGIPAITNPSLSLSLEVEPTIANVTKIRAFISEFIVTANEARIELRHAAQKLNSAMQGSAPDHPTISYENKADIASVGFEKMRSKLLEEIQHEANRVEVPQSSTAISMLDYAKQASEIMGKTVPEVVDFSNIDTLIGRPTSIHPRTTS